MVTYTVYRISCLTNSKLYIGYTKNKIEYRLKQHLTNAKKEHFNKIKFAKAILKYGTTNFKIEPLFITTNKKEALATEIYFIKTYNTIKNGYNTTEGGEGGITVKNRIVSDETKKLISKNHADVSGEKNPFFGKTHSEEAKIKIANREYKQDKNHHLFGKKTKTSFKSGKNHPKSQPITINGIGYESLSIAAKALNVSRPTLKKYYINDVVK